MRATGSFLLDTNIVIALLAGEERVKARLAAAAKAAIPAPVMGELYFGAFKSGRPAENLARLERVAGDWPVVDCNRATAREYGLVKSRLQTRGTPIPENDVWIAALARQHDLVLVTRDDHFTVVDELRCTSW